MSLFLVDPTPHASWRNAAVAFKFEGCSTPVCSLHTNAGTAAAAAPGSGGAGGGGVAAAGGLAVGVVGGFDGWPS